MNPSDPKHEMLQAQVTAKIHWAASDDEVREWLAEKHSITGDGVDRMLAEAHRARCKAVRVRALLMLIFSGLWILITIGFVFVQVKARVFVIGKGTVFTIVLGVLSVPVFIRSLTRLLSGRAPGSVD